VAAGSGTGLAGGNDPVPKAPGCWDTPVSAVLRGRIPRSPMWGGHRRPRDILGGVLGVPHGPGMGGDDMGYLTVPGRGQP